MGNKKTAKGPEAKTTGKSPKTEKTAEVVTEEKIPVAEKPTPEVEIVPGETTKPVDEAETNSKQLDESQETDAPSNTVAETENPVGELKKTEENIRDDAPVNEAEEILKSEIVKLAPKGVDVNTSKSGVEIWEQIFMGIKGKESVPVALCLLDETGKYKNYRKEDKAYFKKGLDLFRNKGLLKRLLYVRFSDEQDMGLLNEILALGGKSF